MKIKRYKKVSKYITFYKNNFGFREPLQILIDGTFCLAALKNKLNIQDQLPKYLQSELKFLTTQCIILETEQLGPKVFGAMKIVKQFAVHKCGHHKHPVSGSECLKSMVQPKNENRYVIATQDREVKQYLRQIPGVPLIYLHQVAPVLDPPSSLSMSVAKNLTDATFGVNQFEENKIKKLKEETGIVEEKEEKPKRRKKKREPNPLSCLKKKKRTNSGKVVKDDSEKEKRKRVKVPKHVREELLKKGKE